MLAVFVWAGIPTWLLNPLLALRYRKDHRVWEAVGVGLALGSAFTIRYFTTILVGLPLLVYLVAGDPRRTLRTSLAVAAGAASPLALMLAYQGAITGSPLLLVTQWIDPTEGLGFVKGHTPARAVEAIVLQLGRLVIWASPALLVGVACSKERRPWVWMAATTFVACVVGHTLYYNLDGNQYGPRFYFEGWALATLGMVAWAFRDPASTAQRLPRFVVIFGALAGAFVLPMLARHEHRIVAERMDLQDRVEQAELGRAVVIVSDGTGVARAMPPYDLTRNGTSVDGEVLSVLDLGADTPERLYARFPDRDIYRYRRRCDVQWQIFSQASGDRADILPELARERIPAQPQHYQGGL
jgi:hypothetical protein